MKRTARKLPSDSQKSQKNIFAPDPGDVLAFRRYTQLVWSKVAGRPLSEDEADRIIDNFGCFIRALAGKNGRQL